MSIKFKLHPYVWLALCFIFPVILFLHHRPSGLYIQRDNSIESIGSFFSRNATIAMQDITFAGNPNINLDKFVYFADSNSFYYVEYPRLLKFDIKNKTIHKVDTIPGSVLCCSKLYNTLVLAYQDNNDGKTYLCKYDTKDTSLTTLHIVKDQGIVTSISISNEHIAYSMQDSLGGSEDIYVINIIDKSEKQFPNSTSPRFANPNLLVFESSPNIIIINIKNKIELFKRVGYSYSLSPNRDYLFINQFNKDDFTSKHLLVTIEDIITAEPYNKPKDIFEISHKLSKFFIDQVGWSTDSKNIIFLVNKDNYSDNHEFLNNEQSILYYNIEKDKWKSCYSTISSNKDEKRIMGVVFVD